MSTKEELKNWLRLRSARVYLRTIAHTLGISTTLTDVEVLKLIGEACLEVADEVQ